ncbi:hypothetical protein AKJ45_00545 [candidate division MSBL1 archaeon SCGC-AAA261F19]|uniref:Helix-turn-helix type 11 domain-containing protein n=3 Tax=candidate division MSBL1 TaxID=215777 RepID=A0A133UY52_9EURY|nr:hypothetical protein AKJ42_03685 [candidate division MSBL1 archaeon SCGC-AAA261C02]KXB02819.1 hypothetical protein AKJ43_00540 [candidate division MSBL1 archaeon SCGC-AAA261D19]KXB03808.1 hypothetical protein AKJ45_00545 [candidate division MSBL1 archaeon SCGC-AAA261F19]
MVRWIKKRIILKTLQNAGKPLSINELSKKIDVPVQQLRIALYRLQDEGEIESHLEKDRLRWAMKTRSSSEKKYEKEIKRYTP